MTADDCIFCAIAAGEAPATVVDANDEALAFLDISPGTRGHALVIPRRHSKNLYEVGADDMQAAMRMAQSLAKRMRDKLGADGVNIVNSCEAAAWQTVWHFHLHVIPRYHDDPLELPWQPTPGDPAELAAVAEELA